MRDNIMITFANQKGGVGKTTLCTMFADYLAVKGESVLVVDFDRQQTIFSKRQEDIGKYEGVRLPYTVQPFDIKDTNNVREFLTNLRNGYKGFVLMDTPGNLSQQGYPSSPSAITSCAPISSRLPPSVPPPPSSASSLSSSTCCPS